MRNKSVLVLFALFFTLASCKYLHIDGFSGSTIVWESGANNFFNQEAATKLNTPDKILITGEVEGEQVVSLKNLPWHSVTSRDAVMSGDTVRFEGAFRYDGYALCDILSSVKINKKSKEDFYPPVDLYVEVWNEKGEYATFSWGELFYSADVYNIIIAKTVTRVIPGKTGELWSVGKESRLVAGSDRLTVRNILNPTKIVIKSLSGNFKVNRDPAKFYADNLLIAKGDSIHGQLATLPSGLPVVNQKTIFYGHGMGYRGEKEFSGVAINGILSKFYPSEEKSLREGLVCIEAVDGYRASFSLSELINRNDYREPLLMYGSGKEKGRESFSLFAGCDMFADRAIKGVSKITLY